MGEQKEVKENDVEEVIKEIVNAIEVKIEGRGEVKKTKTLDAANA